MIVKDNRRILWLDSLKGIAILFMVMRHILSNSYGDYDFCLQQWHTMGANYVYASILWKFIYSFHMPLLFFISGWLFYKPYMIYNLKNCLGMMKKRFARLVIPYFTTGILLYLYKDVFGYWFLCVLFVTNVIVLSCLMLLHYFKLKRGIWHLLFFGIAYIVIYAYKLKVNYMQDYTFQLVTCYPAFVLGLLIKKYPCLSGLIKNKYLTLAYLTIYLSVFIYLNYHMLGARYLEPIMILSIILFFYILFQKAPNESWQGPEGRFLVEIGKYSMEIYILHIFFIIRIPAIGNYITGLNDLPTSLAFQTVYSLILAFIAIKLSIWLSKFLAGSELLNKLLFGK